MTPNKLKPFTIALYIRLSPIHGLTKKNYNLRINDLPTKILRKKHVTLYIFHMLLSAYKSEGKFSIVCVLYCRHKLKLLFYVEFGKKRKFKKIKIINKNDEVCGSFLLYIAVDSVSESVR